MPGIGREKAYSLLGEGPGKLYFSWPLKYTHIYFNRTEVKKNHKSGSHVHLATSAPSAIIASYSDRLILVRLSGYMKRAEFGTTLLQR